MDTTIAVKTISGSLSINADGVVTTSNGALAAKAGNMYFYDYLEVDKVRWGNMSVPGNANQALKASHDSDVTIHYIEFERNKATHRLVVGVTTEDGVTESILVDDVKLPLSAIKTLRNLYSFLSALGWAVFGGIASLAIGYNMGFGLGVAAYAAGFVGSVWLTRKCFKHRVEIFKAALDFAEKHNRIV